MRGLLCIFILCCQFPLIGGGSAKDKAANKDPDKPVLPEKIEKAKG